VMNHILHIFAHGEQRLKPTKASIAVLRLGVLSLPEFSR
jgi:hypothetical protein